MKHVKMSLLSMYIVALCVFLSFCGKNTPEEGETTKLPRASASTEISYHPLTVQNETLEFSSKTVYGALHTKRVKNKIFAIWHKLYMIDVDAGTERILAQEGLGPQELHHPDRMTLFGNKLWIKSINNAKHISYYPLDAPDAKMEQLSFETNAYRYDDFHFISQNRLLMASPYWENGLIKLFDFEKKEFIATMGETHKVELLNRFNVNRVFFCAVDDRVYATESIIPEIQVISLIDYKASTSIKLSPPFYKKLPVYNANPMEPKKHRQWMASWTNIHNIQGHPGWLLITYKWGYDDRYAYELINLSDTAKRFFLDTSEREIYDFEAKNDAITIFYLLNEEEGVQWKTGTLIIP